jgi:predicted permease
VAIVGRLPSSFQGSRTARFAIEGRPSQPEDPLLAKLHPVTPDYFRAMRIPLQGGRLFDLKENGDAPRVAIITRSLAQRYWQDDPIGYQIDVKTDGEKSAVFTIVGVVGDVRDPFDTEPDPAIYVPYYHFALAAMNLVIRTQSDPANVAAAVQSRIRSIDASTPVYSVKTMEQMIAETVSGVRLSAITMAVFGTMGLILAAAGVYAVMAYSVEQQKHDIGVRLALGAAPTLVLAMVLGRALRLTAAGLAIGLAAAVGLGALMASTLFGVVSVDGGVFVWFTLLLAAVALLSSYVPARRAARLDPIISLRSSPR